MEGESVWKVQTTGGNIIDDPDHTGRNEPDSRIKVFTTEGKWVFKIKQEIENRTNRFNETWQTDRSEWNVFKKERKEQQVQFN